MCFHLQISLVKIYMKINLFGINILVLLNLIAEECVSISRAKKISLECF